MPHSPLLLFLLVGATMGSRCAPQCTCYLDHKGRMTVACTEGGLVGPINLQPMNKSIEVLKISAPEDNLNMLTMSPDFQQFTHLEEIHVTRSNVPMLGMHFFWGLTKLEILNLSQNNLTQPLAHNFRGLSNLRELYLDDNRISSLPSGTFRYLHNLRVLSLQRNRIREMTPRIFLEIGRLRVLRLSGNDLGELKPEVFKDVQELRTLECKGCGLKKIDDMFHLLPQLNHLDLASNLIEYIIPFEFRDLANLRVLKLDANRITTIDAGTFVAQTELKRLSLARNTIRDVDPNAFNYLANLTELDLSYNRIEYLDENVFNPISGNLQRLVLSGNHLGTDVLRRVLKGLDALQELHLADVGLAILPAQIIPNSVAVLDISSNHLSSLSGGSLPVELQELNLARNRFKGLTEDVVQKIENLKHLRLENNPWSCDLCHITPLLERTNRSKPIYDIKCMSPYTAGGKILGRFKHSDLTWCNTPTYESGDANFFLTNEENGIGLIAAGGSVLLLSLTILGILAVLCYSRRHAAKYYTHEDKLAGERDSIYENNSPLFGDDRELCFKFPLAAEEKRISIATIDEIKKEHQIANGT